MLGVEISKRNTIKKVTQKIFVTCITNAIRKYINLTKQPKHHPTSNLFIQMKITPNIMAIKMEDLSHVNIET
jgi:Ni,Fe-hydrogenase I cytochrome b subunit